MARSRRRRVFISFHHQEDQELKDRFVRMMGDHIVDRSVSTGDIIDQDLTVDEIRRRIREEYIADATVTVVLIGRCTWQRKHVDWEIAASLIDTPTTTGAVCWASAFRPIRTSGMLNSTLACYLLGWQPTARATTRLRLFIVGRGAKTR